MKYPKHDSIFWFPLSKYFIFICYVSSFLYYGYILYAIITRSTNVQRNKNIDILHYKINCIKTLIVERKWNRKKQFDDLYTGTYFWCYFCWYCCLIPNLLDVDMHGSRYLFYPLERQTLTTSTHRCYILL